MSIPDRPILKFPSVVPDGTYRVRSAARNPDRFLQWEVNNEVRLHEFKDDERRQQWKIFSKEDDVYGIQNVFSELKLGITDWQADGKDYQRLFCGVDQSWTIEPRGDMFVIGVVGNGTCVDLAQNDTAMIWERNNLVNQRWFLEIVNFEGDDPSKGPNPIVAGAYHLINKATNNMMVIISAEASQPTPSIKTWSFIANPSDEFLWTVNPVTPDTLTIASTYKSSTPRYVGETLQIGPTLNTCRIVPIKGTEFFFIALSTKTGASFLRDPNSPGRNGGLVAAVPFSQADSSQQWKFVWKRAN